MPQIENNAGITTEQQVGSNVGAGATGCVDTVKIDTNEATTDNKKSTETNAEGGTQKSVDATSSKMFTQEDLDKILKDRLDRANKSILKKYGVETLEELDAKVNEATGLKQENILIKGHIASERYDDVLTHFKGKGMELTADSLEEALKTHPEWKSQVATSTQEFTRPIKVGAEQSANVGDKELEFIEKYFGVKPKLVK